MNTNLCLVKHFGSKSPLTAYRADMASDVQELVARGVSNDDAWMQVAKGKLDELIGERARIEQIVADAYAKTPAGQAAASAEAQAKQPAPDGETAATPAAEAPARSSRKASPKIEDFGEKLEGARKDYAAQLKDAQAVDVAAVPLSQSWPEPDYQKLLDGGADPFAVAFARAARDEIPTKPQKGWKLRTWVDNVKLLRDIAQRLMSGDLSTDALRAKLALPEFARVSSEVGSRAELYQAVGHGQSLKGVSLGRHSYGIYKGQAYDPPLVQWVVEKQAAKTAFSNWPTELAVGKTREEAIDAFKAKMAEAGDKPTEKRATSYAVYSRSRPSDGQSRYFVGKKIGREVIALRDAPDVKTAREIIANNAAELDAALEKYKETPLERNPENRPRVGEDHRNGAPVTEAAFADAFGFRGVQFGNYVEQGRRQSDLNQAYDALMDLAAVLDVPPRALSLNGQLGLAFGARGHGGRNAPAAHYESGRVVINLAKNAGPGSLAHEWWHGLDNYFARQGGAAGYMTGGAQAEKVRDEMKAAFERVKVASSQSGLVKRSAELDKRKGRSYWDTAIERSARSFESYVIAKLQDQGAANDYLANVVSKQAWDASEAMLAGLTGRKQSETYPYPTEAEMPALRAAFDGFFKAVETRSDEQGNVELREPAAAYDVARQEAKVYDVREPTANYDLFPEDLPQAEAGRTLPVQPASARLRGDVQPAAGVPALAVRKDPSFPGVYHLTSQLVQVGERELSVSRIRTWSEAATALKELRRYAVEHFDVLITDKDGTPLAVVGAFKGARAEANVHPEVVLMEALRIEGAARAWAVHNHPSGVHTLSRADELVSQRAGLVFDPSSIEWMGLAALGEDKFQAVEKDGSMQSGPIAAGGKPRTVPIVERTIRRTSPAASVDSPTKAKQIVQTIAAGKPGLLLLDSQHNVSAWVEVNPSDMGRLRENGRFDRLINTLSEAGAGAAIIANPNGAIPSKTLDNIASALGMAGVRTLDAIDPVKMESAAERGAEPRNLNIVYSLGRDTSPGRDAKTLRASLEREFGADVVKALEDAGLLYIANVPDPRLPARAAGATTSDGEIGLFARNTPVGSTSVAYHEALHATLRKMVGKDYDALIERLNGLADSTDAKDFFAQAQDRIPPETPRSQRGEELAAYAVEQYQRAKETLPASVRSWVREFLAAIRAALAKALRALDIAPKTRAKLLMDPAVLHKLARDGLRSMARDAMRSGEPATQFSQMAPPFYSALSRELRKVPTNAGTPASWTMTLKSLVNKGLVKQDEIEWSGVNEWLALVASTKPGLEADLVAEGHMLSPAEKKRIAANPGIAGQSKITKQQVLDFLDGNGVRVEETVLGAGGTTLPAGATVEPPSEETQALGWGDQWTVLHEGRVIASGDTEEEARANAARDVADDTKFGNYTLPGGTNYREVLLTLPAMTGKQAMGRKVVFDKYSREIARIQAEQDRLIREGAKDTERIRELGNELEQVWDRRDREAAAAAGEMPEFRHSHWDQPNVLAHFRVNDRTDADGKRVLFVEEIQSDWGQQGKKQGFIGDMIPQNTSWQAVDTLDEFDTQAQAQAWADANPPPNPGENMEARLVIRERERFGTGAEQPSRWVVIEEQRSSVAQAPQLGGVPRSPFVTSTDKWLTLALKRIIKLAVDEGYDRVAFVNGEQSAERYDLSKHIDRLIWRGEDSGDFRGKYHILAYSAENNRLVLDNYYNTEAEIAEVVGKDVADRLLKAEPSSGGVGSYGLKGDRILRGLDLKVGGEGMRAFYDQIVPAATKALLKKLGGGQMTRVEFDAQRVHGTPVQGSALSQPGFDITPAMRAAAEGGLPLFSKAPPTESEAFRKWFGDSKVVDAQGRPLVVYHGTQADFNVFESRSQQRVMRQDGKELKRADSWDMGDDASGAPDAYHYLALSDVEFHSPKEALQWRKRDLAGLQERNPGESFPDSARVVRDLERLASGGPITKTVESRPSGVRPYFTPDKDYSFVAKSGSFSGADVRDGGNVMPVYLSIKNPVYLDAGAIESAGWNWEKYAAQGYDGAIFAGNRNDLTQRDMMGGSTQIVAFDKTQIKSATGNIGTFDATNPDIRYSIRTAQDLLDEKGGAVDFKALPKEGKSRIKRIIADARKYWLGVLTRDQIADIYGDEIPPVKWYDDLTRAMESERSKMASDADDLYNEWAKAVPADVNDRLSRIMLESTIAQVHPDRPFDDGSRDAQIARASDPQRYADWQRLSAEFNALPEPAKAIYAKVRDFHSDVLAKLRKGLEERIVRQVEAGDLRNAALNTIRKRFDQYLGKGPYFPLSRFGDYLVIATKGEADRFVASYENSAEQQAAARRLEAEGYTVKLTSAQKYSRTVDGAATPFINDVMMALEKADFEGGAEAKAQLLDTINQLAISALPDLSYRKHFMHRKGTPGFSSDVMRGFASSTFHAAGHIARLNYGDRMTDTLRQAREAIRHAPEGDFTMHENVIGELTLRHDAMLNPNTHPIAAMLNQVGFVMYLGLSPAAGVINALQTVLVTMPYLGSRYGFAKTNAALAAAYKDITTGVKPNARSGWDAAQSAKLTDGERAMMRKLQDDGAIDLTQAHELASATARDTGNVAHSKAAFAMSRAMRIVGWTFHIPEVMNRQVTALMAYRMEMERSGDAERATAAARSAIDRTQFNYSASNRARFMQSNPARVILQFKQFAQNMTYFLGRAAYVALQGESPEVRAIARRQLLATFATTWVFAGALGLPGVGGVMALIGAFVSAMDDKDEPWDWETEFRNLLADTFGKGAGEVISHGVPRALMPWDIANRTSLADLWWRSNNREGQSPREAFASDAQNILGPTAGTALGLYTAADHMARGNWGKAAEAMAPKALRDLLKSVRESTEGVTTFNNEPLMDLTAAESVGRLLGFAPARASEMYEARGAVKNAETALAEKRQRLLSAMAQARMDGDTEAASEAQADIMAFNQRNPEFRITGESVLKSIMARRRAMAQTEGGVQLPRSREILREKGRFAEVTPP